MSTQKNNQGFTLIELMVVVSIISALSSIVLASLQSARTKADNAARVAAVKEYKNALALAYDTNGRYPIIGTGSATDYCLGDYPPVAGHPYGKCADLVYDENPTIYNEITPYLPLRKPLKSVLLFGANFGGPMYRNGGDLGIGPPQITYYLDGTNSSCGFGIVNGANTIGMATNFVTSTICTLYLY